MFEKIAKAAFMDELEKIAMEINQGSYSVIPKHKRNFKVSSITPSETPAPSMKPEPIKTSTSPTAPKAKINQGSAPVSNPVHKRTVPIKSNFLDSIKKKLPTKPFRSIGGALALSGLAFGAGSVMAANSGSGME